MSNKRVPLTEISRFLNERLHDSWAVRVVEVADKHSRPVAGAGHVASRQKSLRPHGQLVSHCHLLVRKEGQRALCQYCGQSFPLTPSGDLDKVQLLQEELSRPLFGCEGRCRL